MTFAFSGSLPLWQDGGVMCKNSSPCPSLDRQLQHRTRTSGLTRDPAEADVLVPQRRVTGRLSSPPVFDWFWFSCPFFGDNKTPDNLHVMKSKKKWQRFLRGVLTGFIALFTLTRSPTRSIRTVVTNHSTLALVAYTHYGL